MNSSPLYTKVIIAINLLLLFLSGCTSINPLPVDEPLAVSNGFSHDKFRAVLTSYVDEHGKVDYAGLAYQPKNLELYYDSITRYSPDSHPELFPDKPYELAYWINAYNVGVLKTVLTHYPIESVLEVKNPTLLFFLTDKAGFFYFQRLSFGGTTTSLYYLENEVIRKRYREPRIHFALNCAAIGCPRLPRTPFTGAELDKQLDLETRKFLAELRNFYIDHGKKTIFLSSIFKWYEEDFTEYYQERYPLSTPALLDYIELYLSKERQTELDRVRANYSIEFIPYDWGLNNQ